VQRYTVIDEKWSNNTNTTLTAQDQKLEQFLLEREWTWGEYSVSYQDGKKLKQLVRDNNSKYILDIGTGYGHSAIWLAKWARKNWGKVITIEIDEDNYKKALSNFKLAWVDGLIDARLWDAFEVIPTLPSGIDFVFSDAGWFGQDDDSYLWFFRVTEPKFWSGIVYTMNNVGNWFGDDGRFFRYLDTLGTFETYFITVSTAGISISKKIR
jgi:predicted O-methyltransferase YrrM